MEIEGVEVRPFLPGEWQLYRTVRLKALENDPLVFGSSFEKERDYADEKWQGDLSNPDLAVFGVFLNGAVIGMTGVAVDRNDPSKESAKLWGSWLEKDWRLKGLSRRMYVQRLAWAKAHPTVKRVTVSHRKSNAVSKRANQRHGFRFTHAEERVWHGGQKETEFFYALDVK
jgi:RimJ/RimL family protein N-acetyltransferase